MHEMSLCEGILQVLEDQAEVQQFSRVKAVWLEIGALAGVEPSAMTFSFDVVCRPGRPGRGGNRPKLICSRPVHQFLNRWRW